MKILIVDDEPLIRNVVKEYCLHEKYDIVEASDGAEAIKLFRQYQDFDIVILDIMMPNLDGFSAYKTMKEIRNVPTIILSARTEEFDKLLGFELGIDDYVTKPFSPKELIARIKAVTKRTCHQDTDIYQYLDLKIDFKGHAVYIDNHEIKITPKEYELLVYFIDNPNIALSREQLLNKIWGYDYFGDDRTVDTHIKMLRNNLGKYRDLITTVRAVGYKYEIKEK